MSMEKKQRSFARRVGSLIVWSSFALVLFLRFVVLREPPQGQPWRQQGPFFQQPFQPRFHRPPTWVRPPLNEVPADLPRIQIEISDKDEKVLRSYFWNGWRGQQQKRPEVLATVREGTAVYTNVALHLKGAAGSFRPYDDKPALTLNFSKHAKGQRFHDFAKVSFNNSVQDSTYLCEAICRELYNAAGVPTPSAAWATVLLNGRDLGMYVMIEGYGKEFLKRHFKNTKGNLYDGGFCQEVNQRLAVNSGEHPEDRSDLERLTAAAAASDSTRWAQLSKVLDVERFASFLAMEALTCNWDGYGMNLNNYRVFHDLERDRMVFMPHGLDQMFAWPPRQFPIDGPIQPGTRGLVARALVNTAEGHRLYLDRLNWICTNVLVEENVLRRIHEMDQHIRPTLAAYDPALAERHDASVASLCDRITRRIQSVNEQLALPREVAEFDSSGMIALTNWTDRFTPQGTELRGGKGRSDQGSINLQSVSGNALRIDQLVKEGLNCLHIATVNRGGTGSWRTRVILGPGSYRFEGRAKVSPEAIGSRVALRVSRGRQVPRMANGTDWIPLSYRFTVDGFESEVVLICEFSGTQGEAWFDLDSLKLVRE